MLDMVDPLEFCSVMWPNIRLFKEQREVLQSLQTDDETWVVAGNMLGKDFIASIAVLWFFLSNREVRIVTTSVKDDHLRVLWGEIGKRIQDCKYPMEVQRGGVLLVFHKEIKKMVRDEKTGVMKLCPISYILRQVSEKGEGMAGHHAEATMFCADEASGIVDLVYTQTDTWCRIGRSIKLIFGNPNPCSNFFYHGVKGGNIKSPTNKHLFRRVIKIKATDSPNVQYGKRQEQAGREVKEERLIPGLIDWPTYQTRRELWDQVRQCIGLDAEFHEGADSLMFPPEWLNRAERIAADLPNRRSGLAMGVDPAEGGDNTTWAIVDRQGLIFLQSKRTPDTSIITGDTIALMREYKVLPENVLFDAGGGGKEHADRLRRQDYKGVRAILFGGPATSERKRGMKLLSEHKEEDEVKYVYKNRRAEMYGILRQLLDPFLGEGFGLPARYVELRRQLAPIPMWTDEEGRFVLMSKNKPAGNPDSTKKTLIELLGGSPDEADALALAVFGMMVKSTVRVARSMV